ncbi:hypothetical protein [Clostridium combesii]|uniref:Spore coat protein n=1 Tax=Clostridium combesii TaxID=39481 RepID=A0A2G7HM57_9CLOT|nr:hypothetical protein [Clostridium combesii]PIH06198.1 hypothetical protein CS538_02510 [Clostridium combesii]
MDQKDDFLKYEDGSPKIDLPQQSKQTAPINIGANCIFQANNNFYLLVEVEAKAPGVEVDPEFVVRLTVAQANALIAAGVPVCQVTDTPPTPKPGLNVEFKGVFVIDNTVAFQVFDVENSSDTSVLVVTRLIPVITTPF